MISRAISRLYKVQEKNDGRIPHHKMAKIQQGLLDNREKHAKEIVKTLCEASRDKSGDTILCPLSVIDVNSAYQASVSSLHRFEGFKNNMAGRPKGSTLVNNKKANYRNEECKVQIALAYLDKMNETRLAGGE
jgi:hypothetical protein